MRALASGPLGQEWLADLDRIVQEWATRWELTIGRPLAGGTEALIVEATTGSGRAAILKLYPPGADARAEIQALRDASGPAYVEVLAADGGGRAALLERLGPPLADLGLSADDQLAALCETVQEAWCAVLPSHPYPSGADKAQGLSAFIQNTWRKLDSPCSARIVETAGRYLDERRCAYDARAAVLVHGDPHPWNALLVPDSEPSRFKLIDPDALVVEPAYDLGILMREWTDELLAGDALALGVERCRRLARRTGIAPRAVWQWGFAERTSTALLCLDLGLEGTREMLAVAERWCAASADAV